MFVVSQCEEDDGYDDTSDSDNEECPGFQGKV